MIAVGLAGCSGGSSTAPFSSPSGQVSTAGRAILRGKGDVHVGVAKGDKKIWGIANGDITEFTYPAGTAVYASDIAGGAFISVPEGAY